MEDIQSINVESLNEKLKTNSCVLIDVRERAEFEEESIEGAINIPLSELTLELFMERINTKSKADSLIVMQCRSGKRSQTAIKRLESEGSELNFINLEGGILKWSANNLETVRNTSS